MSAQDSNGGRFAWAGGPQFLVAQFFAIASTILGVYLAGYVGFQRTLEYDRLQTAERQVNLFTALQAELDDNVAALKELSERMNAANEEGVGVYAGWPELRLYVWNAAARNDALFEGPPELVTGLQAFYADVDRLIGDDALRERFRRLTSSNAYERNQNKARLDALIETAENAIGATLLGAIERPSAIVEQYGEPQ